MLWRIAIGGATVEASVDLGKIVVQAEHETHREPISEIEFEIELELVDGAEAALTTLAGGLQQALSDLVPENISKGRGVATGCARNSKHASRMATCKTSSRSPQQASLFDDSAPETAQFDVPSPPASTSPAARRKSAKKNGAAPPPAAATPQPAAADVPHLAAQFDALPAIWRDVLKPFTNSDAYAPLCRFVDNERAAGKMVYPTDVFHALRLTRPDDTKVVILGQDPYHGDDHGTPQAHGLAFSVPTTARTPPSLRNIFKEIAANFGHDTPRHGCLDTWARQGVLLLNTVLTVKRGAVASHAKRGWEQCTDTLIHELAGHHRGLVFMLWGTRAQTKRALLDPSAHCVLEAPHPSPLSAYRGFFGCRHFALANDYLVDTNREPIDWRLPEVAETLT